MRTGVRLVVWHSWLVWTRAEYVTRSLLVLTIHRQYRGGRTIHEWYIFSSGTPHMLLPTDSAHSAYQNKSSGQSASRPCQNLTQICPKSVHKIAFIRFWLSALPRFWIQNISRDRVLYSSSRSSTLGMFN